MKQSLSLEELVQQGQKIYFEELKGLLEPLYKGQFAVIDVEQKRYQIDPDKLVAIQKAQKAFGMKIFFIIQIGIFQRANPNVPTKQYAWHL